MGVIAALATSLYLMVTGFNSAIEPGKGVVGHGINKIILSVFLLVVAAWPTKWAWRRTSYAMIVRVLWISSLAFIVVILIRGDRMVNELLKTFGIVIGG